MTNSTGDPQAPGTQKRHYRLTHREWCSSTKRLKPAELKVLYYLRTLDPFGDHWLDIHITPIADDLELNKSTVSRALRKLAEQKYLDLEIQTARVRLFSREKVLPTDNLLPTDNSLPSDHSSFLQTTSVIATQPERSPDNTPFLKPAQDKGFEEGQCTNNRSNFLNNKQTGTTPAHHPVENRKQEGIGTLLREVEATGIRANKTIQGAIQQTIEQFGEASAAARVRNALSAIAEQQSVGKVRNPGGMLVAALREGYTSNEAKLKKRAVPQPPDLHAVESAIDQALLSGDRPFGFAKLQQLFDEGWFEQTQELCQVRRDWGFKVSRQGVSDATQR